MGFGLGLGGIQTSSNVADTNERRAYNEGLVAQERADEIKTGLAAVPEVAKNIPVGEIIRNSNTLNDKGTLTQVIGEATNSGYLNEAETRMLNQRLEAGDNAGVSDIMTKLLPARKADKTAIDIINSKLITNLNNYRRAVAQSKGATDDKEKAKLEAIAAQEKEVLKGEIERLMLNEREDVANALAKRLPSDIYTAESSSGRTGLTYEERRALEELKIEGRKGVAVVQGGQKLDLEKARQENKEKMLEMKADYGLDEDASKKLIKSMGDVSEMVAPIAQVMESFNTYNKDGELELVGFTPKYLSSLGMTIAKAENIYPNKEELNIAKKQQQQFMTMLNSYMKAVSGAAVTQNEAQRILSQFGLKGYSQSLIPMDDKSPDFTDKLKGLIMQGLRENAANITPQDILNGINELADVINTRKRQELSGFGSLLYDEDKKTKMTSAYDNLLAGIKTPLPKAKTYEGDYNVAVDIEGIGTVIDQGTKKILGKDKGDVKVIRRTDQFKAGNGSKPQGNTGPGNGVNPFEGE